MLALFRRSQRVFLWLLLIVIVVAFVFWGSQSSELNMGASPSRVVGSIGARAIKDSDLNYAIRGVLIQLQLQGVPREMLSENRELEREAWYRLIQTDAAKRDGLAVSDDEIRMAVQNLFFRNSQFDLAAYRMLINRFAGAMQPKEFESHISDLILTEKVRQLLAATVVVTDQDVRQAYEADRALIKLAYVPFFYTNYLAGQTVSTNELDEFYSANENEFRKPAQVDLVIAIAPLAPEQIVISDEEIGAYYDDNKEKFALTNAPPAATNGMDEAAEPVKEYADLDDVAGDIRATLIREKASDVSFDTAEQLAFALAGPASRDQAERVQMFHDKAAALGLSTLETGWLSLEDELPGITNSYGLVRSAFSMKPGEISEVTDVPGAGHVLVLVRDKRDAYLPLLSEIEDEVRNEVIRRRALSAASMIASQLKSMLESTGMPLTNAAALGYDVVTTVPLDRHTGIDEIGCPAEIVGRLFAFPEGTTVVVPFREGYMLASPLEIIEADFDLLYTDADEIAKRLEREAESVLFNTWFQQAARNVNVRQSLYDSAEEEPPQE